MPGKKKAGINHAILGGITYLQRDSFTDTLAAGAVNGTAARPGPGTRVVVDTNNKISVGSGVLNIAAGAAANDGLWLSSTTRVAGKLMVFQITPADNTGFRQIGFDSNQAGAINSNSFYFYSAAAIRAIDNAGLQAILGAYSATTSYYCALVLRAAGAYYLIKGGAYTSWTLLFTTAISTTATVFPGLVDVAGNAPMTLDFMRVPAQLWLPIPLAYDTFTRGNGVLGTSETSGPDGQATPARAWTATTGTWAIATNVANCTATSGGIGLATLPATAANVFASVGVTRTAGQAGLVLRFQDADNYLYAYHDGTNAALIQRVAGVEGNVIAPAAATYAADAMLEVRLIGTAAELYYNKARVGTGGTAPASTFAVHGLYTNDTNPTLNNFILRPVADGYYDALNSFIV